MDWQGVIPVVTTPFDADGELNLTGYAEHIDRLIEAGVDGVIALATAGEGPSMSRAECVDVVRTAVETAAGRIPVAVGFGGPNERDAKDALAVYGGLGVDSALIVTPYFYPLLRDEMLDYFRRIGGATDLPLCFYNSTYANLPLTPDALEELADDVPNFVALKEGNQLQASDVIRRLEGRVKVLTARDLYMHELLASGGDGLIAFTANVVPELVVELYRSAKAGDLDKARDIQHKLNPLVWMLVKRSFPGGIKAAMELRGWSAGPVRPPLTTYDNKEVEQLRSILQDLGAID